MAIKPIRAAIDLCSTGSLVKAPKGPNLCMEAVNNSPESSSLAFIRLGCEQVLIKAQAIDVTIHIRMHICT